MVSEMPHPSLELSSQYIGNLQGVMLTYNLSEAFTADTNTTGILVKNKLYKGRGGSDASGSIPNFMDGAMLANNASFFLYAGLTSLEESLYQIPDDKYVLAYERYSYGLSKPLFHQGFKDTETDQDVSTYIAYGGGVSVPSENKGWYFSGLQAPFGGPAYTYPTNQSTNATTIANSMVTLDFGVQYQQHWSNKTLPSHIKGRANPEVVWVPVGEQGILVVLGGVIDPEWVDTSGDHESSDPEKSVSFELPHGIDSLHLNYNRLKRVPNSCKISTCMILLVTSGINNLLKTALERGREVAPW